MDWHKEGSGAPQHPPLSIPPRAWEVGGESLLWGCQGGACIAAASHVDLCDESDVVIAFEAVDDDAG